MDLACVLPENLCLFVRCETPMLSEPGRPCRSPVGTGEGVRRVRGSTSCVTLRTVPGQGSPMTQDDGTTSESSARVLLAQGMVCVQAECGLADALILMMDRAEWSGQTLDEIADEVLDRSIRFDE